ncbi:sodium/potassium/calcium exchanger 3-like isoform X2 [Neocloeon triangulifer]|uniref:sodium/potassium/calcium exchanger 3-like isoform X2 n=1 Tax=Neocloeon triangulifer TaxID=2078957 RepID=UPI00286EBCC4|nr:sodium/potassium/calcium exchanger 3-like isoform X2 [Neocloeon triangulifer]
MKPSTRRGRGAQALLSWALAFRGVIMLGVPLIYFALASLLDRQHAATSSWSPQASPMSRQLLSAMRLTADDGTPEAFNCTPPAILDFPDDVFTDAERRRGAALCHAFFALYLFVLLAIVCDDYFVPAIERTIDVLGISDDVGGATLMAAATSSPELFINVVGTFITEGDIGVGAVLGSAVFNILAVPACCGIAASKEIWLDWWPMTRDCGVYALAVVALIACLADEVVQWYEAAILVAMYIIYITLMCFNVKISRWARKICTCWASPPEMTPLLPHPIPTKPSECAITVIRAEEDEDDWRQCSWWKIFTMPIKIMLWLTIPDCKKYPRLYPLTFIMCVCWIGTMTYVISWMITVIGDTLRIPDSVMGITFLAAGTSVPEAVSSIIVTRQGHGGMGISNSLGSNTFDILLCLGLPWLIKASILATAAPLVGPPRTREEFERAVVINSDGLEYSAITLLGSTLLLYATFGCYHFRLNKKVGLVCLTLYALYLTLASLIELNVFFQVNLPVCGR